MPALIDAENDALVSVRCLAKQRLGKNVAPSTIWRWVRKGSRGCRLEAVQVLGSWHSTPEAFGAFITGQTAAALGNAIVSASPAPRRAEKRARLKAAGLLK
ncbi:MAG: DUF1580 domain-containing protein [Planctomycetales bacterium]